MWLKKGEIEAISNSVTWANPKFSFEKMLVLSLFSRLAYEDVREYERIDRAILVPCLGWQQKVGRQMGGIQRALSEYVPNAELLESYDFDGFVAHIILYREILIVAIRGTTSREDWLVNLDVGSTNISSHLFHRGYASEANKLIGKLLNNGMFGYPIYFTGHSLGSAVGAMCHFIINDHNTELSEQGKQDFGKAISHYGYGSPRTLMANDASNDRSLSEQTAYFCVRPNDPVTAMWPRTLGYIDYLNIRNTKGEPASVHATALSGHITDRWTPYLAYDHKMDFYFLDIMQAYREAT